MAGNRFIVWGVVSIMTRRFSSRIVGRGCMAALALLVGLSIRLGAGSQPAAAGKAARTPVLVELFTSEGCSSCPPADVVLSRLVAEQPVAGAEVLALGFHVDYWNQEGWVDRFSSPSATVRQNSYTPVWKEPQVYTPQMVVDGARQFVGHDWGAAIRAISEAAAAPRSPVTVTVAGAQDGRPALQIDVPALEQSTSKAEVWLAITEDGLVSDVRSGENARRRLPHIAVVRAFDRIGSADRGKGLSTLRTVSLDRSWRRESLKAIVFIQESRSRRVVGAASARLM